MLIYILSLTINFVHKILTNVPGIMVDRIGFWSLGCAKYTHLFFKTSIQKRQYYCFCVKCPPTTIINILLQMVLQE